jgi:PAS domain S-box-containing protein
VSSELIKILLIDDREDNLISMELVLEKEGYSFSKATSGRDALKILLKEEDFSLILLEVKMPIMDGYETAKIIYQREKLRHIPIIFITGQDYEDAEVFKGYQIGAVDYIHKPFNPLILRSKVAVFADLYKKNRLLIKQEEKLRIINQKLLEATRTELDKIMDSSLDMICTVDKKGCFLSVSAASETILGYTPDELIGKRQLDFIFPEDQENTKQAAAYILAGNNMTNFENRYIRKDGSLVPLSWSATYEPKDQIRYGVARDATEKLKSEAALIESEKKYKYLFENNPLPLLIWDFETLHILDCNEEALMKYGYTREEFLQLTIRHIRPVEDLPLFEEAVKTEDLYGQIHKGIWRHKKKDGEIMYMEISGHLINYNGRKVSLALSNDVTESRYYVELDRLEKNILEMNAGLDKSLSEVIESYLSGIEALHPGMLCSIMEVRGTRLYNMASPSLPKDYLEAIYGIEVGNNIGSCGTAAFLKQKVIVTDIPNDIRWADYKEIAGRHQLKACWSYPVLDGQGNVVATFASYYREIKIPSQLEENTIQRAGHILSVILESYQKEHALQISNERFEYVTEATADIIWDWNLKTNGIYYSENIKKLLGHTPGINNDNQPFYFEHVHPEDRERVMLYPDQVKYGTMINWTQEYRFRKADGEYAFVLNKGIVIRDKDGLGIRMVGAMKDITKQKEEERRLRLLESVITNTNDSVMITEAGSLHGQGKRILYVNEAFTKMSGYTAEDVIGKTPSFLQGQRSDKKELKRLRAAMSKWQPCEITTSNYKKNGEEYWVNLSVSPVANEKGVYTHWIGIKRDVTERLNYIKAIEEKNEKLKEISWIQSHVIRAPLARLMGLIPLVLNGNDDEKDKILKYISLSANELDAVINNIMEKTKIL